MTGCIVGRKSCGGRKCATPAGEERQERSVLLDRQRDDGPFSVGQLEGAEEPERQYGDVPVVILSLFMGKLFHDQRERLDASTDLLAAFLLGKP
jgi:hypothetical protein